MRGEFWVNDPSSAFVICCAPIHMFPTNYPIKVTPAIPSSVCAEETELLLTPGLACRLRHWHWKHEEELRRPPNLEFRH